MDTVQNRYLIKKVITKKLGFTTYEGLDKEASKSVIIRKYDTPVSSNEFEELRKQIRFLIQSPIKKTTRIIDFSTDPNTGQLDVIIEKPPGRPLASFFNVPPLQKKNILFHPRLHS